MIRFLKGLCRQVLAWLDRPFDQSHETPWPNPFRASGNETKVSVTIPDGEGLTINPVDEPTRGEYVLDPGIHEGIIVSAQCSGGYGNWIVFRVPQGHIHEGCWFGRHESIVHGRFEVNNLE